MPTQKEFSRRAGRKTLSQCERIRRRLMAKSGAWVPMFTLSRVGSGKPHGICVVHSRISDLRRRGLVIQQRGAWVQGQCRSWYRLVPGPAKSAESTKPTKPTKAKQ